MHSKVQLGKIVFIGVLSETPMTVFIGNPQIFIRDLRRSGVLQRKSGVSYEKFKVSNENHGVSKDKHEVSNRIWVPDENLEVCNETIM